MTECDSGLTVVKVFYSLFLNPPGRWPRREPTINRFSPLKPYVHASSNPFSSQQQNHPIWKAINSKNALSSLPRSYQWKDKYVPRYINPQNFHFSPIGTLKCVPRCVQYIVCSKHLARYPNLDQWTGDDSCNIAYYPCQMRASIRKCSVLHAATRYEETSTPQLC